MPGRSIRIFLPEGSPSGLRTAELGLSTIKAVVAPRTLLDKLAERSESKRTGVYLLVGEDPSSSGRPYVYVGEGDEVLARIASHHADHDKEFFDTVYLVVSKDENLTKAHVRWLEARLVERLKAASRCTLTNRTDPTGGALPESDVAEMGEFLEQLQLLLSTLGLNVFSPAPAPVVAPSGPTARSNGLRLHYAGDGYDAQCELRDGTFVVLAGSRARSYEAPTLPAASAATRKELRDAGVIASTQGDLAFAQDYEFTSASRAAQVVSGFSVNGWQAWKLEDGSTLTQWQQQQLPPGSLSPAA